MASEVNFTGYHGTYLDNVESIFNNGLYKAQYYDKWLGPGAYFFINGIGNPVMHAKNWITTNAIDKYSREHVINEHLKYAVLKVNIVVDEKQFVDFSTPDGADLFNYIVDVLFEKFENGGLNLKKGHIDGYVCRWLNEDFNINVFVAERFIKLTPLRRFDYADYIQRQPNCTICAVYDSNLITNFEVKKEGDML